MTNYPIGDFLIQIKNAAMAGTRDVTTKSTVLIKAVADVLKKNGYLDTVKVKDGIISVEVAYHKKQPILVDLRLVSRPGLRVYYNVERLENHRGISQFILTTPDGILMSSEAKKKRIGGEVIAEIW